MLNPTLTHTTSQAQPADTDDAVRMFAVVTHRPDADVHPDDFTWWIAREERLEIWAELAASGLL